MDLPSCNRLLRQWKYKCTWQVHLCWFGECGRNTMSVVVQGICSHFGFYCSSQTFHLQTANEFHISQRFLKFYYLRVSTPGLVIWGFFPQMVILKRLLRPVEDCITLGRVAGRGNTWGRRIYRCQGHCGQSLGLATQTHPPEESFKRWLIKERSVEALQGTGI